MFYDLVKEVGLSKTPTNLDWTRISSINRRILDQKVNRYFFISDPVKIKILGAPEQEVKLKKHPDHQDRGFRNFKVHEYFYLAEEDFKSLKNGKLYRLMDCLNFKKTNKGFEFDSLDYKTFKEKGDKIIHWLPVEKDLVKVEVLMPDHNVIKGLGEVALKNLKENDVVQGERFGFIRLDKKAKNTLNFWFTHK